MSSEFYVYKVTFKPTGEYYWGSRYKHASQGRLPEEDLWIYYFTSSSIIKRLLKLYCKDKFESIVVAKDSSRDVIFWMEQNFIKDSVNDPLCLNRYYIDQTTSNKVFTTQGLKGWINSETGEYRTAAARPGSNWYPGGPLSGRTTWLNQHGDMKFSRTCPGEGWTRGNKSQKSKYWTNNQGVVVRRKECPGNEWQEGGNPLHQYQYKKSGEEGYNIPPSRKGQKKWFSPDGEILFSVQKPGPEWILASTTKKWVNDQNEIRISPSCPGPEWRNAHGNSGVRVWISESGEVKRFIHSPGPGWRIKGPNTSRKPWINSLGHVIWSADQPHDTYWLRGSDKMNK